MKTQTLRSNLILLLAAAIWGLAFVAQRVGARYVGTFTFNAVRFAIGSISLLPLILYYGNKRRAQPGGIPEGNAQTAGTLPSYPPVSNSQAHAARPVKSTLPTGILVGVILFIAVSLQQLGLIDTSAGKAAFITGLYIVLVPVFGIFLKQKIRSGTWFGIVICLAGLYFLSITGDFTIAKGDLLELIGAFFWTAHILVIGRFAKEVDALKLSCIQFTTCAILSLAVALLFEDISAAALWQAAVPILYGGIFSTGVAYTLQVVGQRHAQPTHAAIILSMEAVFAGLGGLVILRENLGARGYLGCALMLFGMLLSQLQGSKKNPGMDSPPAIQVPEEV